MPVIRRTAEADEDLINIWLYIAPDNPGAADRLLDEIVASARARAECRRRVRL
jgi:toxin ParE1/3/4